MDNHYVPNLTVGPMVCKALRDYGVKAPLDVHLMVRPVDRIIGEMIEAGASSISFHPEASDHVDRSINLIREGGCLPGLVLNPATPTACLENVLDQVGFVLLMSVNPGFGGQKFIPYVLNKICHVKRMVDSLPNQIRIQVDGGICIDNILDVATAGADIFVAGTAIFGAESYAKAISELRDRISSDKVK